MKKTGDFELRFYEGIIERKPDYVDALMTLAELYTRKGLYEQGLKIDRRLAILCDDDAIVHYNLACSYALVGDKPKAIQSLIRAVQLGYCDLRHLKKDPDLKCLHKDPDFIAFLSSLDV